MGYVCVSCDPYACVVPDVVEVDDGHSQSNAMSQEREKPIRNVNRMQLQFYPLLTDDCVWLALIKECGPVARVHIYHRNENSMFKLF
jgi:hypothetical protein